MKSMLWVLVLVGDVVFAAPPPTFENALGMRFVELPAAEFTLGTSDIEEAEFEFSDPDRADIADETPSHLVQLSAPTRISQTEVTQAQWAKVMDSRPGPDALWQRDDWQDLPVVGVSWYMAQEFAKQLSLRDAQWDYRLPTEAEWEYAARGGSSELRPVPLKDLDSYAWYLGNSGDAPRAVASLKPNRYGLYDMLGNVWEWVSDRYSRETYERRSMRPRPVVDPVGPPRGLLRIRRGGSFHCPERLVRSGYRAADDPNKRYSVIGFRLVALPKAKHQR